MKVVVAEAGVAGLESLGVIGGRRRGRVVSMNLMTRLKGLHRGSDEKLAEETLEGEPVDFSHEAGVS